MADRFVQTSRKGLGSRLGESIKGVLVGLIMFFIAFPVLFWNEGRAVKTYKMLKEGAAAVVEVPNQKVRDDNDGKLVHISGRATTTEELKDGKFGVSVNAIHLKRNVQMYQWVEKKKEETTTNVGGSETTKTTYEYEKEWSSSPIDSSNFEYPKDHQNEKYWQFKSNKQSAKNVTVGAFSLSDELIGRVNKMEDVKIEKAPRGLPRGVKVAQGGYYVGRDPANPRIGDLRVKFEMTPVSDVSVVGKQSGSGFVPWKSQVGKDLLMLDMGIHEAAAMFQKAQQQNVIVTWVLRLVGFLLMLFGISMIFRPLAVVADIVPFVGNILRMGTGIIGFAIAAPLSLLTIGIAWIFYRPVLGIVFVILAGGIFTGIFILARKRAANAPQPPAADAA